MNGLPAPSAAAVLEALPLPAVLFGPDASLRIANSAFLAFNGIAPGRLPPGTPRAEVARLLAYGGMLGPGDPEEIARQAGEIDRARPSKRLIRLLDGRVVEIHSAPTADGGFVALTTDVTALVAAQGDAAREARRLAEVVTTLATGVAAYGADKRLAYANPAYAPLIGLQPGALREGLPIAEVVRLLEDRGEFAALPPGTAALIAERAATGGPHILQRRRPTGQVVETRATRLSDGGFVLEVSDVTARQNAEDEARRRAALLDAILDALPHGVCVYDAQNRVVMANSAHRALLGPLSPQPGDLLEEMLRRNAAAGEFPGRDVERIIAEDLAFRSRGPAERIRRRRDGLVFAHRVAPLPDGGHVSVVTDISALAGAEADAKAQAALLRALVEGMPFGVRLYDAAERLVAFNEAGVAMSGLLPGDLVLGMTADEVIAVQAARGEFAPAPGHFERITGIDRSRPIHHSRTRPDGTVIEVNSLPMPDGGFLVTFLDVTRLVQAEAAAAARAGLLRAMVDNMVHGVALYDAEDRLVAANAQAARFIGVPGEELRPGTTFGELVRLQIAAGEFAGVPEIEGVISRIGRRDAIRHRRTRPDGTVLDIASLPMPDGGFVISFTDVTRLVAAEQEAKRRAEVQAAMLDNTRHGIVLFDADARLIAANRLAARLTGLPPDAFVPGRSVAELRAQQVASGEYSAAEAASRGDPARLAASHRYVRTRPDGTVIDISTERTPDGLFVRTYTDVTEDRRIRADLEAARAAAEAAARAKSRFLATMTHELRTPLNAAIGFAELLTRPQPPEVVAEFATAIVEAGRDLLGLIDQILDVARSETGGVPVQAGRVALLPLLHGAAAAKRCPAGAAGLTLTVSLPEALPDALADAARLDQVVQGLLSNAVKFTPAGGRVTLSACVEPGGAVAVRVSDTGIGIAEAALPRVFEPFEQLDAERARRYAGSGIGLYLARSIADAMGMRLALDSREGEGTTATLLIPPERLLPPDKESA